MTDFALKKSAEISECGQYRYRLSRRWGPGLPTLFIMLNPSTADAEIDDPTIRRCMGFAKSWGRDGIEVVNLFAFQATSPKDMQTAADPVGPENEVHVEEAVAECFEVICAWGAHGSFKAQDMVIVGCARPACSSRTALERPWTASPATRSISRRTYSRALIHPFVGALMIGESQDRDRQPMRVIMTEAGDCIHSKFGDGGPASGNDKTVRKNCVEKPEIGAPPAIVPEFSARIFLLNLSSYRYSSDGP